ncbi:MAG: type II toxin-antitoxin system RelE/ParE family toxin [Nitrosomonas sp.]
MNEIDWKPKALKQIEKIKAAAVRKRIFTEVQSLADFPDCQGVKKLANHTYSSGCGLVITGYFSSLMASVHVIDIEEVKKRDERTY